VIREGIETVAYGRLKQADANTHDLIARGELY
jgi:hypothetical protein